MCIKFMHYNEPELIIAEITNTDRVWGEETFNTMNLDLIIAMSLGFGLGRDGVGWVSIHNPKRQRSEGVREGLQTPEELYLQLRQRDDVPWFTGSTSDALFYLVEDRDGFKLEGNLAGWTCTLKDVQSQAHTAPLAICWAYLKHYIQNRSEDTPNGK